MTVFAATDKQLTDLIESQKDLVKQAKDARQPMQGVDVIRKAGEIDRKIQERKATIAKIDYSPSGGYDGIGEFLKDVYDIQVKGVKSERYQAYEKSHHDFQKAFPTSLNTLIAQDGGILAPQQFQAELLQRIWAPSFLNLLRTIPNLQSNSIRFPAVNETSRVDGSRHGGVQAYWRGEAASLTATKPNFRGVDFRVEDLTGLVYITNDLLEDSAIAVESFCMGILERELTFKLQDSVINGTGVGMPLGIYNSNPLVTITKETSQTAATFNALNAAKMMARMDPPSFNRAVWLIHQSLWSQLLVMSLGSTNAYPVMLPSGFGGMPYPTLFGRPYMVVENCATLGTVGDVLFTDLSQYIMVMKGGINSLSSIHFRFDTNESAFRMILRADGRPWWNAAMTPFKGSDTTSPFVVVETRS